MGWISKKVDEKIFEEVLLQETMPITNTEGKVAQIVERIVTLPFHAALYLKKRILNFWWNAKI